MFFYTEWRLFPTDEARHRGAWKAAKMLTLQFRTWWRLVVAAGGWCVILVVAGWVNSAAGIHGIWGMAPLMAGQILGAWAAYALVSPVYRRALRLSLQEIGVPVCVCCGYDLTGNRSGVCPECGTPIPDSLRRILNGWE